MHELDEIITIVEHSPLWQKLFQEEKAVLAPVFGLKALNIEHFGSTAVPGLKAKPIIDILIGLKKLVLTEQERNTLEQLNHINFGHAGIQQRLYWRKRLPTYGFNLAITEHASPLWNDNMLIRDYLLMHPQEAKRYANLKDEIIASGATTLLSYSDHKHNFMKTLLERAQAWQKTIT